MKPKQVVQILGGLAAGAGAVATYSLVVRPWHTRWGATEEEVNELLPGDEIVTEPQHAATHAITINAPAAEVWPWLVQIGQSRGGFYSYSWLENLAGCDMHNANRIVAEWQTLRPGDVVWLHPKAPPLQVVIVEPFRTIVLGSDDPASENAGTWSFYLKPIDEQTTRLLVRIRWNRVPGLRPWATNYLLLEPAHFIMERKMLLGIKQRAEGAVQSREPVAV